ncbi:MAG: AMP-binding protein [Pseudomonadota bacterium]
MPERPDYHAFYRDFQPSQLSDELAGDVMNAMNGCVECCDRYVGEDRVAVNWLDGSGRRVDLTFEDLQRQSAQVANVLANHGVQPGDRVAGLLPRRPELVALILGVMRLGAVYQPLFTAFGPKAIDHRLMHSDAKIVVTDDTNRTKLQDIGATPITMTLEPNGFDASFNAEVAAASTDFEPVMRSGDAPFLMMFTSGTTGPAKGMLLPLRALVTFVAYMRYGLDIQPEDTFWNIADPGWAYGLYHGVIGPLLIGHQTVLYDGPFTVESTAQVIDSLGVTNFAAAPTAYRMIIAAETGVERTFSKHLRIASSAGEPLNPEVMRWFEQHVGCPLHDQYGQTESAMMLMNHHGLAHGVRPGAAGYALPGFRLDVVDESGNEVPIDTPGILAVHRHDSPLFFFNGYLGTDGPAWVGDYYLTGDAVEKGRDGAVSFIGRSDDVISSAGYRIGPFDVESCLLEDDAVAESAVIGKPDEERGQIVKAFVVLQPGARGDDALAERLRQHVRNRVGKHAYPREIDFVGELPKTPSGKIQRFLLRQG